MPKDMSANGSNTYAHFDPAAVDAAVAAAFTAAADAAATVAAASTTAAVAAAAVGLAVAAAAAAAAAPAPTQPLLEPSLASIGHRHRGRHRHGGSGRGRRRRRLRPLVLLANRPRSRGAGLASGLGGRMLQPPNCKSRMGRCPRRFRLAASRWRRGVAPGTSRTCSSGCSARAYTSTRSTSSTSRPSRRRPRFRLRRAPRHARRADAALVHRRALSAHARHPGGAPPDRAARLDLDDAARLIDDLETGSTAATPTRSPR